jgi:hypothetical protein
VVSDREIGLVETRKEIRGRRECADVVGILKVDPFLLKFRKELVFRQTEGPEFWRLWSAAPPSKFLAGRLLGAHGFDGG